MTIKWHVLYSTWYIELSWTNKYILIRRKGDVRNQESHNNQNSIKN